MTVQLFVPRRLTRDDIVTCGKDVVLVRFAADNAVALANVGGRLDDALRDLVEVLDVPATRDGVLYAANLVVTGKSNHAEDQV
jgi:hypothetical protein